MPRVKVPRSGLGFGEWVAVAGGLVLSVSLLVLPWFAVTVDGFVQPDSDGAAFELLGGLDVVLLLAALVPLVVPALRTGMPWGRGEWAPRLVTAAGMVAVLVALYVIFTPPEPDVVVSAVLESSAELGLEPRVGAFLGLVAGFAIVAGGALELSRGAGTTAPPEPPVAPKPGPKPKPKSAPKPKPKPKPVPKPKSAPSLLSLASASAEDLVGVGFSTTQAKRIIRYRDEEAIVSRVSDLKRVPGISRPVLAELIKRLEN